MKEIIRKIDVFSELDEKLLHKIADTAITCIYPQGKVMIREGEAGVGMYFIVRGRVAVFRKSAAGEVRLGEIGPNEFVAEMALIDEKPRAASVVTMEETECVLFTRDTFRQLIEQHPALTIRLVRVMTETLRAAHNLPAPNAGGQASPAAATNDDPAIPVSNGTANHSGMKASVEKKLLDIFEMLYTVKAFTRFSVAVLGCPVTGSGADALDVLRVGEVTAVMLPASRPVELSIGAYGAGQFRLHVFHPDLFDGGQPKALRFDPVTIQPDDRFTLSLPAAVLTRHERVAPEPLV